MRRTCFPGYAIGMARAAAGSLVLAALLLVPADAAAASESLPPAASPPPSNSDEARLAGEIRRGGVVVLVRHSATDPGVGDPPGFRLDDCSSQRNLSDTGREQARRLGRWFAENRIRPTSVRASPWCRTVETAQLAFGASESWPALSNLIADRSREAAHSREVLAAIAAVTPGAVDVYVSHGVTINAFVGIYLQQGELAVIRPAAADRPGFELVGRLLVP